MPITPVHGKEEAGQHPPPGKWEHTGLWISHFINPHTGGGRKKLDVSPPFAKAPEASFVVAALVVRLW